MKHLGIPKKKLKLEKDRYHNTTSFEKVDHKLIPKEIGTSNKFTQKKMSLRYNKNLFATQASINPYVDIDTTQKISDYFKSNIELNESQNSRNLSGLELIRNKMVATSTNKYLKIREKPLTSLNVFTIGK